MKNIQRSLRGALLAGPALLLLACGDAVTDPTRQRFMGCDVEQIFIGESRSGTLGTNDCLVQNHYTEMWFLDVRNDEPFLIIDLESFDFVGWLQLYDWDTGELLGEGGPINDFTNDARIAWEDLPRGRYVIAATTFNLDETGQYTLTVD